MIRCRKCGITYNDDATVCLRCFNPLPQPSGKSSSLSKKLDKHNLVEIMKTREQTLIATATPRPINLNKSQNVSVANQKTETHLKINTTESLQESSNYLQEIKQLKESLSGLEPDKTIEQLNPIFGDIKVSEVETLYSIVSDIEHADKIYARSQNRISFDQGYLLENGYITHLNLLDLKMSRLPNNLVSLKYLSNLDLEKNLFDLFPSDLEKLQDLKGLNFSENKLRVISSSIGKLSNLEYLWLYDNELEELPSELGLLTNLEHLDLRGNKLTDKNINAIFELKNLKFLSLESNNIRILTDEIANLTELEILLLGDNPIEKFPDIVNLKNLKELSLYSTKLSNVPESVLTLSNLKTLDIWNTSIKSDDWILKELIESGVAVNLKSI